MHLFRQRDCSVSYERAAPVSFEWLLLLFLANTFTLEEVSMTTFRDAAGNIIGTVRDGMVMDAAGNQTGMIRDGMIMDSAGNQTGMYRDGMIMDRAGNQTGMYRDGMTMDSAGNQTGSYD